MKKVHATLEKDLTPLRESVDTKFLWPEAVGVRDLARRLGDSWNPREATRKTVALIRALRRERGSTGVVEAFLDHYGLHTPEGRILMSLAEAYLRIPDTYTLNLFIEDRLGRGSWASGASSSAAVNLSATGMLIAKTMLRYKGLRALALPTTRLSLKTTMHMMGAEFVVGESVEGALKRSAPWREKGYTYSFDMLGEAARTWADADRYYESYRQAILQVGKLEEGNEKGALGFSLQRSGVSIKLSALHPRYEPLKRDLVLRELTPRLVELVLLAMENNVPLNLDAEEVSRLEVMLDVYERVLLEKPDVCRWGGLGIVVQAYQKRALWVVNYLLALAGKLRTRIPVRLVKGAYWDTEIKLAQESGLAEFPVFTRKCHTDLSYLACAKKMLAHRNRFYPKFATHNAQTICAIWDMAGLKKGEPIDFEFQRLHGMGEKLYETFRKKFPVPCRIYGPVGVYHDLLPYLVRRLLENGANSSFVHQVQDPRVPPEKIATDPVAKSLRHTGSNPLTVLPKDLYAPRPNSRGFELSSPMIQSDIERAYAKAVADSKLWTAGPIVNGQLKTNGEHKNVASPADTEDVYGPVYAITKKDLKEAIESAVAAFRPWERRPVAERSAILRKTADLFQEKMFTFMAIMAREGGKTVRDAMAEVREAVDALCYYADQAEEKMQKPSTLPGPTGEKNTLELHGRGTFVCISPWNFPLAIFSAQVAAALVTGNSVLAKPAGPTPITAYHAVRQFHAAGVPTNVLQLVVGEGSVIGDSLASHPKISGVAFTGSSEVAHHINQVLAAREKAPIAPLIAETGGQNAMILDSTALPEQAVLDIMASAFQSAGQRCSAARVLFVQEEIADRMIAMIRDALKDLKVDLPSKLDTDVGPIIDGHALKKVRAHKTRMRKEGKIVGEASFDPDLRGFFFAPCLVEIPSLNVLKKEIFGPFLHVIRFGGKDLDRVVDQINATGYGLTFGLETRIQRRMDEVAQRVEAGNVYINRTIIGAVIETQPFGGEKLSGTGPKAGGPHYILRFTTEKAISNNVTVIGGNTALYGKDEH